ncbi:hypothetical protein K8R47_01480 [archaeon]|nr:hypothetical protein [archaeon]
MIFDKIGQSIKWIFGLVVILVVVILGLIFFIPIVSVFLLIMIFLVSFIFLILLFGGVYYIIKSKKRKRIRRVRIK